MSKLFIGNSNSLTVHLPDCGYASQIHPDNFEVYEHLHEALAQEYYECRWCLGEMRDHEYKIKVKEGIIKDYKGHACVSCGERRGAQDAHIVPKKEGGKDTMPLCPTCHWNYDHNLLTGKESKRIQHYLNAVISQ
jgi:5-methylcytosine-specific restriction endonuclease McrA